ncbi:MAG: hypothetical protein RL357_1087 [Pseudomonadota bacterium]|jgi:DNA-binding LytR/AlgR family response regulator
MYAFEKLETGVIHLDARHRVVAMNDYARAVLPVDSKKPFNQLVTAFHPEPSRAKIDFLINQADTSSIAAAHAAPMTMIINIPEQMLLIRLSRLTNEAQEVTGYVLVFHDVTALTEAHQEAPPEPPPPGQKPVRQLGRIPLINGAKVQFVDIDDVQCIESNGHTSHVITSKGEHVSNLSIGDLEARLDASKFMRVHRRYLVNLRWVEGIDKLDHRTYLRIPGTDSQRIVVSRSIQAKLKQALGL